MKRIAQTVLAFLLVQIEDKVVYQPLNDPDREAREFPGTDVAAVNRQLDLAEFR